MNIFEDDRKNNIETIKPLYKICEFLTLVPPYKSNEKKKIFSYKLRAAIVVSLLLFSYVYSFFCITRNLVHFSTTLSLIIDLTFTLAIVQLTSSILITAFRNSNLFCSFILNFNQVDKYFDHETNQKFKKIKFELWSLHIFLLILYTVDLFISIPSYTLKGYFQQLILRRIEIYFNVFYVHLMYSFNLAIKYRFQKLNELLKNTFRLHKKYCKASSSEKHFMSAQFPFKMDQILLQVRKSRFLYNLISKLVFTYSKIFGWPMLFIIIHTGVSSLELICKEILSTSTAGGRIKYILFATTNLMMGVIIAITCDATIREAKKISTACYSFLTEVPIVENNEVGLKILRSELSLLAEQAATNCPHFSAAGFFKVDYTALFGLLGALTSYVIVVIQINK